MNAGLSAHELWRMLRRNRMAFVGLIMLVVTFAAAIFAPWITPYDPYQSANVTINDIYRAPDAEHLLGTDDAGKDVFSGFIYGSRVSLTVGFFASFISIFIGGVLGITAGFYGGRVENLIMRFTDIMLVIPELPLMVVIVALTKPSLTNIIIVIGVLGWTTTARIVRAQALSVTHRKFVLRARALGAGSGHIILHHILPMVMPLLVVNTVLEGKNDFGYNAATGKFENLMAAGVIDPTKVVRFALQNAASVAGLMITTEAMITEKPEKKKKSAAPMPDMDDDMY